MKEKLCKVHLHCHIFFLFQFITKAYQVKEDDVYDPYCFPYSFTFTKLTTGIPNNILVWVGYVTKISNRLLVFNTSSKFFLNVRCRFNSSVHCFVQRSTMKSLDSCVYFFKILVHSTHVYLDFLQIVCFSLFHTTFELLQELHRCIHKFYLKKDL